MSKEELQDYLNRGYEFEWEYEGAPYSLVPTFGGVGLFAKDTNYDFPSVQAAIEAGFDLEKMTDGNDTLSF